MLRIFLLGIGALLMVLGIAAALAWHTIAGLPLAGAGTVLLLAILLERRRYKHIEDHAPGPDWQPTGERFLDPGSNTPVAVYFHKATGKQVYVRVSRN